MQLSLFLVEPADEIMGEWSGAIIAAEEELEAREIARREAARGGRY